MVKRTFRQNQHPWGRAFPKWCPRAVLGHIFEYFWDLLGAPRAPFEVPWCLLGRSWHVLVACVDPLAPQRILVMPFGSTFGAFGHSFRKALMLKQAWPQCLNSLGQPLSRCLFFKRASRSHAKTGYRNSFGKSVFDRGKTYIPC